jgi:DNA-binding beta-propeller fold protein YncE
MKKSLSIVLLFVLPALTSQAQQNEPLKLIQAIGLPGVEGYFDHMGIDVKGQRLFVPANREPDNGIYDPETGLFYIGDRGDRSVPGSKGSIEIVDTRSGTYVGSITVDDSDPAGLALDPGTSKMYVVLGMTSRVAVIDRKKREVLTTWPITGGPLPHALALDAVHQRLFIGSRIKKDTSTSPGRWSSWMPRTAKSLTPWIAKAESMSWYTSLPTKGSISLAQRAA